MQAVWRLVGLAALGLLLARPSAGAEVRVFGVAPVRVASGAIAQDFTAATGIQVALTIVASNVIDKELPGKPFDLLLLGSQAMDALESQGKIAAGSRVRLARTGIGVGVRDGTKLPDLTTPDAFRQTMLAARSIVYRDTAETDLSGYVAEQILKQAGILDAVRPKIRIESLSASHALIAKGEVEIGLYNVSEGGEPRRRARRRRASTTAALLQFRRSDSDERCRCGGGRALPRLPRRRRGADPLAAGGDGAARRALGQTCFVISENAPPANRQ